MPDDRMTYRPKNMADIFINKLRGTQEIFVHSGPLIKDLIRGFLGTATKWVNPAELERSIMENGDKNTQSMLVELQKVCESMNYSRHRKLFYKTMLFGLWYSCFDPAYSDPLWNLALAISDRRVKLIRKDIETDPEKWWINLHPK